MYQHQEYPKTVYGPLGDNKTIEREEERPDGYVDHPDDLVTVAVKEAETARKRANTSAKKLREGYVAFLDLHKVAYDSAQTTEQLAELVASLEEHLAKQAGNGNGE